MGLWSWILTACDLSSPSEQERYGYDLPIDTTTSIWNNYLTDRAWSDSIMVDKIAFLTRDEYKNTNTFDNQGVGAIDTPTGQVLWHTPFPVKVLHSIHNHDEKTYIQSSSLVLAGDRLFCAYMVTIPPQNLANNQGTSEEESFWEYIILDAQTGKILRNERAKLPNPTFSYQLIGTYWFALDREAKQTIRLDPATGEKMWTYNDILSFSTFNDRSMALYRNNFNDKCQVTVLDVATGKPLFDKQLENFSKHVVRGVLYRADTAFVEIGAQYEMNFELGSRYKTYTVAFDAKTQKPLWRTPFFSN